MDELLKALGIMIQKIFASPEADTMFVLLVVALMEKIAKKFFTEADIEHANTLIANAGAFLHDAEAMKPVISKITDETHLTAPKVEAIVAEAKVNMAAPDTTKKKVSRTLRAIFRGWFLS